ncbi:uncharacterized protein LOC106645858 [Copidosoma floridanum]|uniref:uncharacterized protein LOC106645858 n=1 Tax=Copidosoma floridanum TaxID=29053 RepID=UPI0006C99961|nr:uncharacterized protein LOC106645858 [Copidosoma floridanum]
MLLVLLAVQLVNSAPESSNNNKCLCQASGCLCCVELNLTKSLDLGGPACVNVRQRERNVTLNLSYADNPVHNATIDIAQAAHKPTCINMLLDFAQICAKFDSMRVAKSEGSYDGCLVIEPVLLGMSHITYPVGCFNFNGGQVRRIEPPQQHPFEEEDEDEEDEEETGLNTDELIAAVSASAEQGIAMLSQWLAQSLSPRLNVTSMLSNHANSGPEATAANGESDKLERPTNAPATSSRHGRTITVLGESEQDKNEERFKQLLSAQDNILKESATIGKPPRGYKTAFLYSQPDTTELRVPNNEAIISLENLAVVPSDSRRGGRAYNIHQHINEV